MTVTVTPDTFDSAVAAANGGDTLRLVGTFGKIRIQNQAYSSKVTINASQATFTDTVTFNNDQNIFLGGGTFDITGAPQYTKAIEVYGGSNIVFSAVNVIGSAGGDGIGFNGTAGGTVRASTFTGLQAAVIFGSVTNGYATRNTITGAVSDGIDIANSHGVTASYNSCSAGNPGAGVHPDCIQLWSVTGQPLQSQIIVSNNTATGPTQGFTAFASMGGEQQIQIINNTVNTSFPQGVACYECVNSNISYNTLTTLPGSKYLTNLTISGGSGNTVQGNVITPYDASVSGQADGLDADPEFADHAPQFARFAARLARTPAPGFGDQEAPDLDKLVGGPPPPAMYRLVAGVPEPSNWALLIAGFTAVGVTSRRARLVTPRPRAGRPAVV